MSDPEQNAPDRLLQRLHAEASRDARLRAEIARAWREFHGSGASAPPPWSAQPPPEALRFFEWYLIERPSEVLGGTVLESLCPEETAGRAALRDSIAGVFLVEQVAGDEARLRDLQDGALRELDLGGHELAAGDLLVGRLFPLPSGSFGPSPAAGVRRDGGDLAAAFARDYQSLAPGRRLTQAEIERIWFPAVVEPAEPPRPIEHLEADLDALLRHGGPSVPSAGEVSEELRRETRPGRVIGPLLEQLAFDSDVDLMRLQEVLLGIWNHHHAAAGAKPAPPPAAPTRRATGAGPLGAELARRIEEGIRNGEDLEALFDEISDAVGGDDDAGGEEEPEPEADLPFEGDLDELIHEYLWETGSEGSADAATLQRFLTSQRTAPTPALDLERIPGSDLVRFLLQVYLEHPPRERVAAVRAMHRTLQRFYRWAEATQGYDLGTPMSEVQATWLDELDRVHGATVALAPVPPPAGRRPELLRVSALLPEGFELTATTGGDPWLIPRHAPGLRVGDLVLGTLRTPPGHAAEVDSIVLVLPAAVEPLFG